MCYNHTVGLLYSFLGYTVLFNTDRERSYLFIVSDENIKLLVFLRPDGPVVLTFGYIHMAIKFNKITFFFFIDCFSVKP